MVFKSLDKSQRYELLKIADFKAHLDAKFQAFAWADAKQDPRCKRVEYKFGELEIYTCFDANTYKRSCEAGEILLSQLWFWHLF